MVVLQRKYLLWFLTSLIACALSCAPPAVTLEVDGTWPSVTRESKPWTRWWWHGSAVTREGITSEMEAYQRAGIGGLEITPIYGVYGEESQFVPYLSPEWLDLLVHVLNEAERLDMGIDMATGTGWPFGGPWVTNEDACRNIAYKVYDVAGGSRLAERVGYVQQPYLRLVGTRVSPTQLKAPQAGENGAEDTQVSNAGADRDRISISDIVDPVSENQNLQALAIDQVQFEKPLALTCLMAYRDNQQVLDLTGRVDSEGRLDWTAPDGSWKLYAVFTGFHGKMVERAGPGGEGNVIDHFSETALRNYLRRFDEAFEGRDISRLRAFFNDSYEVDDARGAADFTPRLFDEFKKRRGYDLRYQLPALFGKEEEETNKRVLCDYRETLSELLLENFTQPWKTWANAKGAIVRNQAHGSPANILDLYATVDIPEIEGTEPLRIKMASSSGNVSGKKLISAEAATWLNEHFTANLADIKDALDNFMLHGVNHLVYHGTCYSPPDAAWPGRLFYAAVHMNPRNPLWKDAAKLNSYVTGCQTFLQSSGPDNDILLYYPVYDRFSAPGPEMIEHFDGIASLNGTSFARCAEQMLAKGYAFDYISDKQIGELKVQNGMLQTSGNALYRTIVIPKVEFMPLQTLEKIATLSEAGAKVIFIDEGPRNVSGFSDLSTKAGRFQEVLNKIRSTVVSGTDVLLQLANTGIRREAMTDLGIAGIRKKYPDGRSIYFIKNVNEALFEGWVPVSIAADGVMLFDPMTGKSGRARIRKSTSGTDVFVRLEASQSLILESYSTEIEVPGFPYIAVDGRPVPLTGKWRITFDTGGPELPASYETDALRYWTDSGESSCKDFSGTATYALVFDKPAGSASRWLLRLESVKETAEVFLNGKPLGTLIGPVFQLEVEDSTFRDRNVLEIKVSNLMANRISYLDRNKIFWKRFYNVNFPARLRENSSDDIFTAAHWKPRPSGLSGKVELYPLR